MGYFPVKIYSLALIITLILPHKSFCKWSKTREIKIKSMFFLYGLRFFLHICTDAGVCIPETQCDHSRHDQRRGPLLAGHRAAWQTLRQAPVHVQHHGRSRKLLVWPDVCLPQHTSGYLHHFTLAASAVKQRSRSSPLCLYFSRNRPM